MCSASSTLCAIWALCCSSGRVWSCCWWREWSRYQPIPPTRTLDPGHHYHATVCAHHPGRDGPVPALLRQLHGCQPATTKFRHWARVRFIRHRGARARGLVGWQSPGKSPWMSIVNMAGYNCSLLVWLGYCAMKNAVREDSQPFCGRSAGSRVSPTCTTRCLRTR